MFLFLIDYAARLLRPVSILARVGDEGMRVIEAVYPSLSTGAPDPQPVPALHAHPARVFRHAGTAGIVLAFDHRALRIEARLAGGVIECVPHVGDFVATDEALLKLYGGAAAIDDARLRAAVALGAERTLEQDPLFAFRIIADIALKALSPAVNDPTTAVLAIDQLQRLLRGVGCRQLTRDIIEDEQGAVRLIYRTPNWADFVHISCVEIRLAGAASSVQVARRLRAMLNQLVATLPPHRHTALVQERERLDEMIQRAYQLADDLALARVPDAQGLGASQPPTATHP
jgi:uncharacterized membrane protein